MKWSGSWSSWATASEQENANYFVYLYLIKLVWKVSQKRQKVCGIHWSEVLDQKKIVHFAEDHLLCRTGHSESQAMDPHVCIEFYAPTFVLATCWRNVLTVEAFCRIVLFKQLEIVLFLFFFWGGGGKLMPSKSHGNEIWEPRQTPGASHGCQPATPWHWDCAVVLGESVCESWIVRILHVFGFLNSLNSNNDVEHDIPRVFLPISWIIQQLVSHGAARQIGWLTCFAKVLRHVATSSSNSAGCQMPALRAVSVPKHALEIGHFVISLWSVFVVHYIKIARNDSTFCSMNPADIWYTSSCNSCKCHLVSMRGSPELVLKHDASQLWF